MKHGFRISDKLDIIFGVEFGIERPRIIVSDWFWLQLLWMISKWPTIDLGVNLRPADGVLFEVMRDTGVV